jgi:TolB-like protein/DNA-binding winged helix-turn-helix (wHTH) protein/Tfp pilus assembly protein PilF
MELKTGTTESGEASAPAARVPHTYDFGPYRLDRPTRKLLRHGKPVPVTPKAFDTLVALIDRRDRVVDKAELMKLVWPDSFVEESNLSQTIFVLRKTLGEAPDSRPYIETVPRRGYRFAAEVRIDVPGGPAGPQPAAVGRRRAAWIFAAVLAAAALAWFAASSTGRGGEARPRLESLVVLPFGDLSDDNEPGSVAASMTDALITSLSQISGLRVISRTSALTYQGTTKTVPQIARELNVDGVVEGTVQRVNGRVRLNLKLIHAATDRTLWAQSYERDLQAALDLPNEIARTLATRTSIALTPHESARLAETPRVDPKVYAAYLRGRHFWNRRSEPDMRQAIEHFGEALRHDPSYAPAYAGLADSFALYGSHGWILPGGNAWGRAVAAAERALQLDELLADGHTSRARIALNHEMDWAAAGRGYRRALELNPNYANARHWYGYYLMLTGRIGEGEAEMRRALELDPLSPIINANIGMCLYVGRQYDAALAHWRSAGEMHRNYPLLHMYMASGFIGKAMYTEALAEVEKSVSLSGVGPWELALKVYVHGRSGRTVDARTLLAEMRSRSDVPAYYMALAHVGLGRTDEAFEWLERSLQERWGPFNELNVEPLFDPLREDPRFAAVVRRLGLPTRNVERGAGN